jgi:WD40 repeat protein
MFAPLGFGLSSHFRCPCSDFKKCWTIKNAGARAIKSVGFSGDGKLIASVGGDDNQTVRVRSFCCSAANAGRSLTALAQVWDYSKESAGLVGEEKGDTNKIYQVKWNHKVANEFVTVGDKHIYFWTMDGGKLKKTKAQMAGKYPWQAFYSVAFSEKGYACCGGGDGSIYVFVDAQAKKVVKIHSGKVFSLDWYAGGLVSGGGDSTAVVLDKTLTPTKNIKFNNKVSSVYIQGENLLVGTAGAEIYEVRDFKNAGDDESKLKPVVRGHFDGELWGLATNPDGKTFITAGEDNTIYVWNIATHELLAQTQINDKRGIAYKNKRASTSSAFPPNQCARAVCYSPDGAHVAVGTNAGEVHVFKSSTLERVALQDLNKYGKRNVTNQNQNWIQAMRYSPTGNTLAVGSHGFVIVLLDVRNGYQPGGVLDKHNASITHMDWSVDGKAMQSNDMAYELLFWSIDEKELKNSRQNTSATDTKDVRWATQTCILGWSVQGIFDPQQDGTDVNCVDTSPSRTLVATGYACLSIALTLSSATRPALRWL